MKKIVSIIMITALLLMSFTVAVFANKDGEDQKNYNKSVSYRISESPTITFGRFVLPLTAVEKGLGASVVYSNGVILVSKGNIVLEFDLNNKKVFVTTNAIRVEDTTSGIFNTHDNRKIKTLINYIADKFGISINIKGDNIYIVTASSMTAPTSVVLTPVGGTVVTNTLNSTNQYLLAQAVITAGQATGGKAELYIGSRLIASDLAIAAADAAVTFTTSDGTPLPAELQALIPAGGKAYVKLYNSTGEYVISKIGNPELKVDYISPVITSLTAAEYYPEKNKIKLYITGAVSRNDVLDVTKVQVVDISPAVSKVLTNSTTYDVMYGSMNQVVITIKLSDADAAALSTVGGDDVTLILLVGVVITDPSGNPPASVAAAQTVKLTAVIHSDWHH
jgi:hypothetical protein